MNNLNIVQQVVGELQARGVDTAGPCGAFQITKRVAWRLRDEDAGLLSKPAGNNCEGYSVDVVAYRDGQIYDVLADAGNGNGPLWNDAGRVDPGRWRPAIDPVDEPAKEPEKEPPPVETPEVLAAIGALTVKVDDVLKLLQAVHDRKPPRYTAPIPETKFMGMTVVKAWTLVLKPEE